MFLAWLSSAFGKILVGDYVMVGVVTRKQMSQMENLFHRYYRSLSIYALHYLKDLDAAEDIVQECFVDLWEKQFHELDDVKETKSYLYTMVRNRCVDILRKRGNISHDVQLNDLEDILPDEEDEERSHIEARLWTAIDSLPVRCREIFLLSKRDGMKYQEIADHLHISVKTVENQVRKALQVLRSKAEKIYYFFFG